MRIKTFVASIVSILALAGCSAIPTDTSGNLKTHGSPAAEIYSDEFHFNIIEKGENGEDKLIKVSFGKKDLQKFAPLRPLLLKDEYRLFIGSVPDFTQKGARNQYSSNSPYWTQENKDALMEPALITGFYAEVIDLDSLIQSLLQKRGIIGGSAPLSAQDYKNISWGENDLILDGALTALQPIGGAGAGGEADDLGLFGTKAGTKAAYTFKVKKASTQQVLYAFTVEVDVTKLTYGLDLSTLYGENLNYKHLDFSSSLYSRLTTAHKQAAYWAIVRATGYLNGEDVVTNIPYMERQSYAFAQKYAELRRQEEISKHKVEQLIAQKNLKEAQYNRLAELLESAHMLVGHGSVQKRKDGKGLEICHQEEGDEVYVSCFYLDHLKDQADFSSNTHAFILSELQKINDSIDHIDKARAYQGILYFQIVDLAEAIERAEKKHKADLDAWTIQKLQLFKKGKAPSAVTIEKGLKALSTR